MANNERRRCKNCTICGSRLSNSRKTANQLENSEVLDRIRDFNSGYVDEGKLSRFVMCKTCRDEVDAAYRCVKKCQSLVTPRPSAYSKQFKDADSQTESPERIIIVNQLPCKLDGHVDSAILEGIFSQYGIIVDFYLKFYLDARDCESFARITYESEESTLKVIEAARNGYLLYDGKPLVITRVSEDSSPIDILPDACLSEIFLHVDYVKDKVALGKVCKRWNQVLARSWSNITELSDGFKVRKMETVGGLKPIVEGCGRFLKSLKFRIYNSPAERLKLIADYCKNIEKLQLDFQCSSRIAEYQHQVPLVFQQCTKLCRLHMQNLGTKFNYNHLEHLPKEMLMIHLHSMFTSIIFSFDLSKFKSLEALELSNFCFQEDSLKGIENLVNLEYLSFKESRVHPSNIRKIQNFRKLKHLVIANCGIDDGILSQIVQQNLNLEHLDISNNRSITDRSFQYVPRLSKLKTLYMENLTQVIGSDLTEIHTLQCLNVEGCSSITDFTLITVIDKSPKLHTAYVAGPATWRLLINAEESIELGHAYRYLVLYADEHLSKRWRGFGKSGKKLSVSKYPLPSVTNNWRGWRGNVERLF